MDFLNSANISNRMELTSLLSEETTFLRWEAFSVVLDCSKPIGMNDVIAEKVLKEETLI